MRRFPARRRPIKWRARPGGGAVAAMALGPGGSSAAEENDRRPGRGRFGRATADAIFEYLVAEIASQRGDNRPAPSVYSASPSELKTRDRAPGDREPHSRARLRPGAGEARTPSSSSSTPNPLWRARSWPRSSPNEADSPRRATAGRDPRETANRGPIVMQISHLLGKFPATRPRSSRPRSTSSARYEIPSRITPWAWRRSSPPGRRRLDPRPTRRSR